MKLAACYVHSLQTLVYMREGYTGITYSDGAETEARLLQQVRSCADVSDGSAELSDAITDWASEYHFSVLRANLLRPFRFDGKQVLELGCGCGAITRFLGEAGAQVIAIEGSPTRAAIAAARCRDLPNVRVVCDNLADFQCDAQFDVVTLIGVLEYARLFIGGDDPVQAGLAIAMSHLKDEGQFFLAIENQLGLKYFNGCGEDHTGVPYFGINDLYTEHTAVTFGRLELTQRLQAAGFSDNAFFFPFPDYKLPELILSEAALVHPQFKVGDILCRTTSRDYGRAANLSFSEGLAWQTIGRNGLVADLANSFLVRATRLKLSTSETWLARTYSAGRRRTVSTENTILELQGKLRVVKRRLCPPDGIATFFEQISAMTDYVEGQLHVTSLQRLVARGAGIDQIATWALPWMTLLLSHADDAGMLPAHYVDCIPSNLVCDANGTLHYIDAEWMAESPIPLYWVAVRGLITAMAACPVAASLAAMTCRDFVTEVLHTSGCVVGPLQWKIAGELEDRLRLDCCGPQPAVFSFEQQLARTRLEDIGHPVSGNVLGRAEAELKRVKGTFSWQVTKPLRFIYNRLRALGSKV